MTSAQSRVNKIYGGKDAGMVGVGLFAVFSIVFFYSLAPSPAPAHQIPAVGIFRDFIKGPGIILMVLVLSYLVLFCFFHARIVLTENLLSVPMTTGKGYPDLFSFFERRKISVTDIRKIVWFRLCEDILFWSLPSSRIHVISADGDDKVALSLSFYGEEPLESFVEELVKLNKAIVVKDYDSPETKRYSDIEVVPGGRWGSTIFYRPRREKK